MSNRKEYLDAMESLLGHPGWKYIEEDARKQVYQLQADALDIRACKTWDQVNIARGRAEVFAEILMLSEVIANQRDQHELARGLDDHASV
jgi:hypothetical protein